MIVDAIAPRLFSPYFLLRHAGETNATSTMSSSTTSTILNAGFCGNWKIENDATAAAAGCRLHRQLRISASPKNSHKWN